MMLEFMHPYLVHVEHGDTGNIKKKPKQNKQLSSVQSLKLGVSH